MTNWDYSYLIIIQQRENKNASYYEITTLSSIIWTFVEYSKVVTIYGFSTINCRNSYNIFISETEEKTKNQKLRTFYKLKVQKIYIFLLLRFHCFLFSDKWNLFHFKTRSNLHPKQNQHTPYGYKHRMCILSLKSLLDRKEGKKQKKERIETSCNWEKLAAEERHQCQTKLWKLKQTKNRIRIHV